MRNRHFGPEHGKPPLLFQRPSITLIFILLILFLHVPGGIAIDRKSNDGNSVKIESNESPLLQLFNEKRADIDNAVSRGELPESAGAKSENIWFSLKKYLIAQEARIKTLKLEASRYEGKEREMTLGKLVEAGAEKERTILEHIRKLEKLTTRETLDDESTPEKEKILDVEVEFKPEDIIRDDQAME